MIASHITIVVVLVAALAASVSLMWSGSWRGRV